MFGEKKEVTSSENAFGLHKINVRPFIVLANELHHCCFPGLILTTQRAPKGFKATSKTAPNAAMLE